MQQIAVVSELCGYGKDINAFEQELSKALKSIRVEIKSFQDLKENQRYLKTRKNIVIAPETPNQL